MRAKPEGVGEWDDFSIDVATTVGGGGPTTPYTPGRLLTSSCSWFTTPSSLIVVLKPDRPTVDVDRALSYALAWQGDQDLTLVVPDKASKHYGERLTTVRTPVDLWEYDSSGSLRRVTIPARSEVLEMARSANRPVRSTAAHDLGLGGQTVEDILKWAGEHWALVEASRGSYRAWHCEGTKVLSLRKTKGGVLVVAGVEYKHPDGSVPFFKDTVNELSKLSRAEIERAVTAAIAGCYKAPGKRSAEHRLQANLALARLGPLRVDRFFREYPAWRGDGRPGFIDFLALDRQNCFHVIETKVGTDDPGVVLQAVDYATWVAANGPEIREDLGWPERSGPEDVIIDLVLSSKVGGGQAVGPYLAGQLEALDRSIGWRVTIVLDPTAEVPETLGPLRRLADLSTLPPGVAAQPVVGARWATRVAADLSEAG